MEYEKIVNRLNKKIQSIKQLPRYVTKKWIKIYDESDGTYNVNKDIRFETPQFRSNLCDWNDAYIIVTGKITVSNPNNNAYDKKLAFKKCAQFFSCVLRINNILMDDCSSMVIDGTRPLK